MPFPATAVSKDALPHYARKIAHDLNNFSTVVRTYSELLLAELPADSSTYADVAEIQRAAEGMVQYIARVTRFARANSIRLCPIDVSSGIAQAVERLALEFPARHFEMALQPGTTMLGDQVWWRDIMVELLMNAHEAAPSGTPISVTVKSGDGWVETTVIDSGNGISPEVSDRLMEPFVSSKQGVRGAGIGLALVGAFLEAAGGTMSVHRDENRTSVRLRIAAA